MGINCYTTPVRYLNGKEKKIEKFFTFDPGYQKIKE